MDQLRSKRVRHNLVAPSGECVESNKDEAKDESRKKQPTLEQYWCKGSNKDVTESASLPLRDSSDVVTQTSKCCTVNSDWHAEQQVTAVKQSVSDVQDSSRNVVVSSSCGGGKHVDTVCTVDVTVDSSQQVDTACTVDVVPDTPPVDLCDHYGFEKRIYCGEQATIGDKKRSSNETDIIIAESEEKQTEASDTDEQMTGYHQLINSMQVASEDDDLSRKNDVSEKDISSSSAAVNTTELNTTERNTTELNATEPTVVSDMNRSADSEQFNSSTESEPELTFGTALADLPTNFNGLQSLGPLHSAPDHTVLYVPETLDGDRTPQPSPAKLQEHQWDNEHVRMPYSPQNKILEGGSVVSRWSKILSALKRPRWTDSHDLERAIMSYNKYRWDFTELHNYFTEMCEEEQDEFFVKTLPMIAQLALSLTSICTRPIPLLLQQKATSVSLSQHQAASLLANAFFCTFPSRNFSRAADNDEDAPRLPSINFNTLYRRASPRYRQAQHAKFDCLLNYFRRVTTEMPRGTVTFHRQVLLDSPDWSESDMRLQPLCVTMNGTIEDDAPGLLQVDFANKVVGGGVLGEGCVQEEIRFLICPELIVSRLLTEELEGNETLVVTGAERYSNYSGYGNGTRWLSNHIDAIPRDVWGRRCTEVVAMDAAVFRSFRLQLTERGLRRELNKAYCGFHCTGSVLPLAAVATGNWGCGVFGGDLRLKALLQLMAASQAGRPVAYFTFGERSLCRDLYKVYASLTASDCSVGQLWNYITETAQDKHLASSTDLYRHIIAKCSAQDSEPEIPETLTYSSDFPDMPNCLDSPSYSDTP